MIGMSIDNWGDFRKKFSFKINKIIGSAKKTTKLIANDLHDEVRKVPPHPYSQVGYAPNYTHSVDHWQLNEISRNPYTIQLINTVFYITFLEYGSNTTRESAMLRKAIARVKSRYGLSMKSSLDIGGTDESSLFADVSESSLPSNIGF